MSQLVESTANSRQQVRLRKLEVGVYILHFSVGPVSKEILEHQIILLYWEIKECEEKIMWEIRTRNTRTKKKYKY